MEGGISRLLLEEISTLTSFFLMFSYLKVWLNSMLKLSTNDEMVAAGELCLAAGVMSPVPCMLSFARSITEYILEQNVDFGMLFFRCREVALNGCEIDL